MLPARKSLLRLLVVLLALVASLSLAATPPAAQAAGESVSVEQTIVAGGTERTSASVPSGSFLTLVLKYRCESTADPCQGEVLTLDVPSGLNITQTGTSAHVQSTVALGGHREFRMTDLPPGSTGAIAVDLEVPGTVTPNGQSWSWTFQMTGANTPPEVSNAVDVTAAADSTQTTSGRKNAGGALDAPTIYQLSACNDRRTPATTWGPLGVASGSQLVATLPQGAVALALGGGVLTTLNGVQQVTWTLPQWGSGCYQPTLVLSYPKSDPSNVLGATKQIDLAWTGREIGQIVTGTLATGNLSHQLTQPVPAMTPRKTVQTPRIEAGLNKATVGDTVTYFLNNVNSGTSNIDDLLVADSIPDAVDVTAVDIVNVGVQPASFWYATKLGADGQAGTADDGQLVARPDVAPGATVTFTPSLAAGDHVTRVKYAGHEVRPGGGGDLLRIRARVLRVGHDGVDAREGQVVTNSADFDWTATVDGVQTQDDATKNADFTIDIPSAGLFVRNFGATVPTGSRVTPELTLAASPVVDNDLVNPVFVLQLPAGFSLEQWTTPAGLPQATLTTIPNFRGTQDTLLRFTFPRGTVALKDTGYSLKYKLRLARGIYTTRSIKGYINSTSQRVTCYQNFFDGAADTGDRDGDGDTSEVLCPWFADITHPTSSAAVLTASVKGDWDTDFVDGPGTGYTNPGASDSYRLRLESQATMGLDRVSIIDVLPRPGDVGVVGGAQRNRTTKSFPVVLRSRPQLPTLPGAITTYYSTATNPCRSDYGFSPAGCAAPAWTDWDATPPADLADVTAVKFDFGTNVLASGDQWVVDLPVTTPASGTGEDAFAVSNPSPTNAADDELARNTAAFEVRRADINAVLLPSESLAVGLQMPSIYGPPRPTTATDLTSSGVGTDPHVLDLAVPAGGAVELLDGTTATDRLTVPGVGAYTLDPATGRLRFVPEAGYVGTAPAVSYRRRNVFGQQATATYVPTVTRPAGPSTSPRSSQGPVRTDQEATVTPPAGGTVRLVDGSSPATRVEVPGEGVYVLDPATGRITFTPAQGFRGRATGVPFVVTDPYGQTDRAVYTPTVTTPAAPAAPDRSSTGVGTAEQEQTVVAPPAGRVRLLGPDGREVTSVAVAGKGRFELEPATGKVTFVPERGFQGRVEVPYRVTDEWGSATDGRYVAEVTPPPAPSTGPSATSGKSEQKQSTVIVPPAGGRVDLLDAAGAPVAELVVKGQGRYVLDRTTGTVTFEPEAGFTGTPTPVRYRITDAYGQQVAAEYQPFVEPPAAAAPADRSCASRRLMTIHWWIRSGTKVRRFELRVNGAKVATLPSDVREATVDMRGRVKETVAVQLVGVTRTGARVGTQRVYRTCRTRQTSAPLATLRLTPMGRRG